MASGVLLIDIVEVLSCTDQGLFLKKTMLITVDDVKTFINANGHLLKIPSTKKVAAKGKAQWMQAVAENLEELTLYVIQLEERLAKTEKKRKLKSHN